MKNFKKKTYILGIFFYISQQPQHEKEEDDVQLYKVQWLSFQHDIDDLLKKNINQGQKLHHHKRIP